MSKKKHDTKEKREIITHKESTQIKGALFS